MHRNNIAGVVKILTSIVWSFLLISAGGCGGGGGGGGSEGSSNSTIPPPNSGIVESPPIVIPPAINPQLIPYRNHLDRAGLTRFYYPSDWTKEQDSSDPGISAIVSYYDSNFNDVVPYVALGFRMSIHDDIFDDEIVSTLLTSVETEVAGFSGVEETYDAIIDGIQLRISQHVTIVDEFIYGIQYATFPQLFHVYEDAVRHMAKSMGIGRVFFNNLSGAGGNSFTPGRPAIASDGENYLVVSCKDTTGIGQNNYKLLTRLINSDGTSHTENQINQTALNEGISTCEDIGYNVVYDGVNYQLIYRGLGTANSQAIYYRRISPQGEIIDDTPVVVSSISSPFNAIAPMAVFGGNKTLVVWHEKSILTNIDNIIGAFVYPDGSVSNRLVIDANLVYGRNTIYVPQVAYGNNQFMVVWSPQDSRGAVSSLIHDIYGQLLSTNGTPLLTNPILIKAGTTYGSQFLQIASDGTNYLTGWIEDDGVVNARLISPAGNLLNGHANDPGVRIDRGWPDAFRPNGYLNLTYSANTFRFLWVEHKSATDTSIYSVDASTNLSNINNVQLLLGTRLDSFNLTGESFMHPNIVYVDGKAVVIWYSHSRKHIEGWLFDSIKLKK